MKLTESPTIRRPVSYCAEEHVTVADLVRKAIGTRTITQFCEDSGLSVGYVSRLLNGKLKNTPSVRTLAKIARSSMDGDTNGVLSKLLEICGYEIDQAVVQKEIRIAERTTGLLEMERKDADSENYDMINLRASAFGLLFSSLLVMGVSLQPKGDFGPHEGLAFGIGGYPFDHAVAISGFCGNSHHVIRAERDILQQLLARVARQKDVPMYLVLTDQIEVYDYISEAVKRIGKINTYILLANKNYQSFDLQTYYSADGNIPDAPFDFVKKIQNKCIRE